MENKNYPQYIEEQIFEIFKAENLKSIADAENYFPSQDDLIGLYQKKYFKNFQENVMVENIELFDEKTTEIKNEKIWKLSFDIKNCNDDLKLFVAQLYIFRPNINNPNLEKTNLNGIIHYGYNQNFSDWNYSSIVSCCFEKLYNYWDRIGDIISLYLNVFNEKEERKIAFASVVDNLDKKEIYSNDENFKFLKSFKDNQFKDFNKTRKEVVHYNQFETTYRYSFMKFRVENNGEEKIMEIWEWKKNMPEYFKNQLELSLLGYDNCYNFIKNNFQ
jgi:hypothetical protein